jgi:phosphomannomutase
MTTYVFDVDGVLCDAGQKVDPEFQSWFIDWGKEHEYIILTGGERQSTIDQIGLEIVNNSKMQFHCMGNQIFIEGREYRINQFDLKPEELHWLNNYIKESPYHTKTGNHIEQRYGSVNVSILGRNATMTERNEYKQWDSLHNERKQLAIEFQKQFPRFEAYVGGNTSIDICLRNANKASSMYLASISPKDSYFFGDKCMKGGIDHPLIYHFRERWFQIDNGYKETWDKLKTL